MKESDLQHIARVDEDNKERGQKRGRLIPVIVMTAMDTAEVATKVRTFGVEAVLPKHGI